MTHGFFGVLCVSSGGQDAGFLGKVGVFSFQGFIVLAECYLLDALSSQVIGGALCSWG